MEKMDGTTKLELVSKPKSERRFDRVKDVMSDWLDRWHQSFVNKCQKTPVAITDNPAKQF